MIDKYFTVEKAGAITIINLLFGELSMEEAEEMRKTFHGYVTQEYNKFIIDLSRCVFMSSVALGVLVSLTARVHSFGGFINICSPTKEVASLLEITKLSSIYAVYDTREAALASFNKSDDRR